MGWTNSTRGILSSPIITIIICIIGFISLIYINRISNFYNSPSIFGYKPCQKCNFSNSKKSHIDIQRLESSTINTKTNDKLELFDGYKCNHTDGNWVFNTSIKPLYTDRTCPYIDRQYACVRNGRIDLNYMHWHWQPDECVLPRFDPEIALTKLKGKRLMFVGDSLQRNQWQSFVCLVESIIPQDQQSMTRHRIHSIFKAKEYNASIEFYWAPFLVESNTDIHTKFDPNQKIVKVDSITQRAQNWLGVDLLVFNTYVWWMSGLKIKTLWGEFENGEEGYEELDTEVSYRLALKTWANWIDSTVDSSKTRIFFTTMSPTHLWNKDWGNMKGIKCFNETKPVMKRGHWGFGSNKEMMKVVANVIKKMKVHVTVLNITQLSEYRIDGHSSIYGELYGKLLSDEQKNDPLHFADCIHWCLPGVPDTWNQLLFAYL